MKHYQSRLHIFLEWASESVRTLDMPPELSLRAMTVSLTLFKLCWCHDGLVNQANTNRHQHYRRHQQAARVFRRGVRKVMDRLSAETKAVVTEILKHKKASEEIKKEG